MSTIDGFEEFYAQYKEARAPAPRGTSRVEKNWLQKLRTTNHWQIEEQHKIGRYKVDGFVPNLNLVLEFMGCYYHSCIFCGYSKDDKRYTNTMQRLEDLKSKGYNCFIVWECQYKKGNLGIYL